MVAIFGITALEKHLLPECMKGIAPEISRFANRSQGFAIFYGNTAGCFPDGHRGTDKMLRNQPADPCILHIFKRDSHPAMIFIFGIGCFKRRNAPDVFHPHVADPATPVVPGYPATSVLRVE